MKVRLRDRLGRQTDDVWGVVLLVGAILLGLSFFDKAGPLGNWSRDGLELLFGLWAVFVPLILGYIGFAMVGSIPRKDYARVTIGLLVVFVSSMALFHLLTGAVALEGSLEEVVERGGVLGSLIAFPLDRLIGFTGAAVVLLVSVAMGALVVSRATIRDVWLTVFGSFRRLRGWLGMQAAATVTAPASAPRQADIIVDNAGPKSKAPSKPKIAKTSPQNTKPPEARRPAIPAPSGDGYTLPPLELLDRGEGAHQPRKMLERTAQDLESALLEHGVDARLTRIVPGPTVTRYEIELAPGVKVSKITSLSQDIAYALASVDVRILAPIPGRSAVGVEVPNRKRELVTLGDILTAAHASGDTDPLRIGLGKDISGNARMLKLDDLPHVLIAGATGAGKSSCINALVVSILMRAKPDEVRMIMVDPKRVELGQYNDIPHLLTRVITNPKKAADALEWAVSEMDRRYDLLADAGVRDITSYRTKWEAGGLDKDAFDKFPRIIIIVDELNDLMMVAGRVVEDSIVRIAQMARAIGIHLVLATQRPSVNVITGVIKANIPSRLAFSVSSQTDSRVILDTVGAEKLIGLGDMLVVTAREPKPERIQGAFVSEGEVRAVVEYVKAQCQAQYDEKAVFEVAQKKASLKEEYDGEDPTLMRQAIELIVRSQLGSTSMLQRKLRVGFARAGRIMDILEERGIVGPSEGSKAREVLVTEEQLDDLFAESS
ncbi:MAG: DNA translocase FtsK [Acidobacteria bacterium]|nr:DNA translocase FtsK [Acidobacteriota bacterium]